MTWSTVHLKKLTVPAWTKCKRCKGKGVEIYHLLSEPKTCTDCNGDGGKWAIPANEFPPVVTKSTILTQLYDVCGECGGNTLCNIEIATREACSNCPSWQNHSSLGWCCVDQTIGCPHCLKDTDGSPTGAAPDTGQGWKIEEVER